MTVITRSYARKAQRLTRVTEEPPDTRAQFSMIAMAGTPGICTLRVGEKRGEREADHPPAFRPLSYLTELLVS